MKKLLFIMLFVFASTLTSLANITVNEARLNVLANEKSMILSFSNESEKVESLTITDFSGIVFYSEEMDKYEYGVKYSLEKLPYGKYRVKVTGQNFIEFHEIFVTGEGVERTNFESYVRPTLSQRDSKLFVEALSTEESDLHLMIFDLDGRLVYDYEEGSAGKFEKTFDLENLKGRDYNVVVSNTYFVESLKLTM